MRINALEARVKEQRAQESAAAVNAAANFLRAGDIGKAQSYVDRAARDPERAAAVNELREAIRAMGRRPLSEASAERRPANLSPSNRSEVRPLPRPTSTRCSFQWLSWCRAEQAHDPNGNGAARGDGRPVGG